MLPLLPMRLLWLQGDINDAEVASALGLAMVLCGIALVLVFAALIAHMRSPVLAIVAMGQVLVSIPVAQYFYLRVFDVYIIYLLNFLFTGGPAPRVPPTPVGGFPQPWRSPGSSSYGRKANKLTKLSQPS